MHSNLTLLYISPVEMLPPYNWQSMESFAF